ncbi:MAG: proline--tRNA ligase [archaeon]
MAKQEGITIKKEENFSEWYTQVIQKADLADYTEVSGCIVFKPYSFAIWEKIQQEVDTRIKLMGVQNAYFPLLIPEKLLIKEQKHVEGFTPEVAWVTHAGDTELEEKLAVRPTSEAIMYDSYSKWIRSWRDLPLKINQWNNVVRWEFKHAVPFLRTREFLWNEGHTVFATREEAVKETLDILRMYDDVCSNYLALYGLQGKKTEKEKFAGAEFTLSLEFFLPQGKAIQGPDAHHDGQNFAKAYDITFLDKNEKKQYVWQNTWAITTRMIGVMIYMHSDDKGLVLPPKLAPIPVVVIPILFKEKEKPVITKCKQLMSKLKKFNAHLDDSDNTAGWKFNNWEMKGVPIRIEIGPKDVENNQVTLVRRDTGKKIQVKETELVITIEKLLEEIQKNLYNKSKQLTIKNTINVTNKSELIKAIKDKKLAKAFWCGNSVCEENIKHETEGAKILNMPLKQPTKFDKCVYCGKQGTNLVYIAKSY